MDDARLKTALDTDTGVALKPFGRIEVLRGMAGRRRVWTLEQKLALVAEMERCDNIAAFARQREISTALLYTWRREFRYALEAAKLPPRNEPMFVPVVGEAQSPVSHDVVELEIGGAVVRMGQGPGPIWWWRSFTLCERLLANDRDRAWCTGDGRDAPRRFRKGPDALAALVGAEYGGDAYSGVIYVFRAKRAQRDS